MSVAGDSPIRESASQQNPASNPQTLPLSAGAITGISVAGAVVLGLVAVLGWTIHKGRRARRPTPRISPYGDLKGLEAFGQKRKNAHSRNTSTGSTIHAASLTAPLPSHSNPLDNHPSIRRPSEPDSASTYPAGSRRSSFVPVSEYGEEEGRVSLESYESFGSSETEAKSVASRWTVRPGNTYVAQTGVFPKRVGDLSVTPGDIILVDGSARHGWLRGRNITTQCDGAFPAAILGRADLPRPVALEHGESENPDSERTMDNDRDRTTEAETAVVTKIDFAKYGLWTGQLYVAQRGGCIRTPLEGNEPQIEIAAGDTVYLLEILGPEKLLGRNLKTHRTGAFHPAVLFKEDGDTVLLLST